jgi:hypothetical protein
VRRLPARADNARTSLATGHRTDAPRADWSPGLESQPKHAGAGTRTRRSNRLLGSDNGSYVRLGLWSRFLGVSPGFSAYFTRLESGLPGGPRRRSQSPARAGLGSDLRPFVCSATALGRNGIGRNRNGGDRIAKPRESADEPDEILNRQALPIILASMTRSPQLKRAFCRKKPGRGDSPARFPSSSSSPAPPIKSARRSACRRARRSRAGAHPLRGRWHRVARPCIDKS